MSGASIAHDDVIRSTEDLVEEKMEEDTKDNPVQRDGGAEGQPPQREGFTSEIFKIEMNNLPKFFSVGQAKKLFKKLGLEVHKFKPVGHNARYMFVNFANEDDRSKAIEKLNGFKIKGNKLKAFAANAAKDPMLKIRSSDNGRDQDQAEDTRPAKERLAEAVCSLGNLPYQEQLSHKLKEVKDLAAKLRNDYCRQLPLLKPEEVAIVDDFIPSPVVNGYRNKCEFTIGYHPETNEVTVGFRLASYKKGSVGVVEADHLPIVSDLMKSVVKYFQAFVRESGYAPFNHFEHSGHWKQLTLRTNRAGDVMAWAVLHPQEMSTQQQRELADKVKNYFSADKSAGHLDKPLTSLYIQFMGQKQKGSDDPPVELLSGSPAIAETLMNGRLKFEISPQSFFQVNVAGAEKLYSLCADLMKTPDNSGRKPLLFDVCCGTGTIGLCLADQSDRVVGVDIVEEAVVNARKNAKQNGVTNAEYHAGRAEHLLPELLKRGICEEESGAGAGSAPPPVAIVDPPRAGLHHKAVQALRASPNLRRLVYVACDAKAAYQSLVSLGKPPSNAFPGDPFVPRRIIPVDLFPHTRHYELAILFDRIQLIRPTTTHKDTTQDVESVEESSQNVATA